MSVGGRITGGLGLVIFALSAWGVFSGFAAQAVGSATGWLRVQRGQPRILMAGPYREEFVTSVAEQFEELGFEFVEVGCMLGRQEDSYFWGHVQATEAALEREYGYNVVEEVYDKARLTVASGEPDLPSVCTD